MRGITEEASLYKRNLTKIMNSPRELAEYYNIVLPEERMPLLVTGMQTVDGGWYNGNIFGKDSNISRSKYEKLLGKEARLVPEDSKLIKNKWLYNVGVWFSREGLKWKNTGFGFHKSIKVTLFSDGILGKITKPMVSIFASTVAIICEGLGSLHTHIGIVIQADSIYLDKNDKLRQKIDDEIESNLIDLGVISVGSAGDILLGKESGKLNVISSLFYKETNEIVNWFKANLWGIKHEHRKKK